MQAGQTFIQTLLLQAMALYIHGPLRCKDLLGRIPNPHSRSALAAPQHAPGPRSDARSQRTPPGEIMHRSAAPHPAAAPATERPAPPAHLRSDRPAASRTHAAHTHTAQIRHPAAHAGSCAAPAAPHPTRAGPHWKPTTGPAGSSNHHAHDQTAYAPAARPVHAAPVLVMGKLPGGHCPTHSKPHPDRPQISQPEPPRPRRRASEARHSIRHTARPFFKSKAQIRHILAISHPL